MTNQDQADSNVNQNQAYDLLTLEDGQQVIVPSDSFIRVDVSVTTEDGETFGVDKREPIVVDSLEEHSDLLAQAMTNTLEIDTMTGKAQAVPMNTDIPNTESEAN